MTLRRGFTIIELMLVLVIIGLLLGAAAVSINTARMTTRDGQRLSDLTLVSHALEQSVNFRRGAYPTLPAVGTGSSVMCVTELIDPANSTNNPYGIDLSIFTNRKLPKDPSPVTIPFKTVGCTSYLDGYTYHGHSASDSLTTNYTYVLEVGLEREKGSEEDTLLDGSQLGGTAITSPPNPRYQYFLTGRFCGTSC